MVPVEETKPLVEPLMRDQVQPLIPIAGYQMTLFVYLALRDSAVLVGVPAPLILGHGSVAA